ncbi:MAG: limonene-1,2-epoxide hydrolase family protein [Microthrixaceae bacterium]
MTPEETVNEFISRVVSSDFDGAVELVSDDLVYDNVPIGVAHGPQELKDFLLAMMAGMDEVEFIVHRQCAGGNIVMNERTDRFLVGTEWIGLPVSGVFELNDDGKIGLWRDYFDAATFFEQMETATNAS